DLPGRLQVPGRERRHAMAGDADLQEARRPDFSVLEHRGHVAPCRNGVAVLEFAGLHAGGPAGPADAAAEVSERVPGEELFEQGVAPVRALAPTAPQTLAQYMELGHQ